MKRIIFQPIRTPGGCYIYDRSVNTIFSVSPEEYEEFQQLKTSDAIEQAPVICKYRQRGLLRENNISTIQHPATDLLPHCCENRVNYMILQVTQQCNLRCSYCAYSGMYYNRQHNSQRMSFETAKKAIDFFLKRTSEVNYIRLGFYGGEPLLEFDLIKQCVAYINSKVEGKKVSFTMTTNGTLLTDEKIKFIAENDFHLMISLDGPKKEHDACRVFPNGQGSFDIIMKNLRRVKELYPEYAKKINISTVISPKADLNDTLEYFNSDEFFADRHITMNAMADVGLKEQVDYQESFHLIRKYEYLKYLLYIIGKMERKYVSNLVIASQYNTESTYKALQRHVALPSCTCPGGPCIPSVKKLFVTVQGTLYPCEKISESSSCGQIGSLDDGFDLSKMEAVLNIGSLTADECKNCWALPMCKICIVQMDHADGQSQYTKADKVNACKKTKSNAASELYEACVLHEFGYQPNEEEVIL